MKTKLLAAALFALTTGAVLAWPLHESAPASASAPPAAEIAIDAPVSTPAPAARPKIDAVFVLDTTGSMSGLIDAAKQNIWSIASSMARAQPTPELRIGLVAFRDRGDAYVTQVVDLSTDLDSMYAKLMEFQADGGGDTPESVNRALHDAVHMIEWSQDANAYRTIFLVGDAPAHHDYENEVPYEQTIKDAISRGIVVNTLQAGNDPATTAEWQRIAGLNQGRYLQVGQQGDHVAMATPFDVEIAELSKELDETRLFYGNEQQQRELAAKQEATAKLHAAAPVAARAKRAEFNASSAGHANAYGDNELVEAVSSGRVDLDAIAPSMLPAPMQALSKDEQAKVVADTAAKRTELNQRLGALAAQRRDYVAKEMEAKADAKTSLDYQLFDTVKEQAAARGLKYSDDAPVN